jgi:hypothetical protein
VETAVPNAMKEIATSRRYFIQNKVAIEYGEQNLLSDVVDLTALFVVDEKLILFPRG